MFGRVDYDAWADTMNTNVFGVLRATEAIVPSLLLSDSPKLVMISSAAGSITNATRAGEASPDMMQTVSGHQKGRVGSPGYFVYYPYSISFLTHDQLCFGMLYCLSSPLSDRL